MYEPLCIFAWLDARGECLWCRSFYRQDDGSTLTVTGTVSGAFSANGQTHDFTMIYTRQ
jgi:hypothetical protein